MESFAGKVHGVPVSGPGLCQTPSQLSPPWAEELGVGCVGCMGWDAWGGMLLRHPRPISGISPAPTPARGHAGRAATSHTSALPAALLASGLEGSR